MSRVASVLPPGGPITGNSTEESLQLAVNLHRDPATNCVKRGPGRAEAECSQASSLFVRPLHAKTHSRGSPELGCKLDKMVQALQVSIGVGAAYSPVAQSAGVCRLLIAKSCQGQRSMICICNPVSADSNIRLVKGASCFYVCLARCLAEAQGVKSHSGELAPAKVVLCRTHLASKSPSAPALVMTKLLSDAESFGVKTCGQVACQS